MEVHVCSPYQVSCSPIRSRARVDEASRHGAQRSGERWASTRPQHVLRRGNRAGPEPILELSGDALTESPSLKRREISQSHVVGFDHGVRPSDSVESADDEPGVTARLRQTRAFGGTAQSGRDPSRAERLPPAGNAPDEEGGGLSLVADKRC